MTAPAGAADTTGTEEITTEGGVTCHKAVAEFALARMQDTERGIMPIGNGESSGRAFHDEADLGTLWQPGGAKAGFFGNGVNDCDKLPGVGMLTFVDVHRVPRAVPAPERAGVGRSEM